MVWNDLGRIWEGFGKPTPAEDMFYPTHQPISALFPCIGKTCPGRFCSHGQHPIFFLVLFLPEGGGEDGYQCDDFKTACQHQDGHDPLASGGQEIVRTGDARYTRT